MMTLLTAARRLAGRLPACALAFLAFVFAALAAAPALATPGLAPTVTSVSPASGPAGRSVVLTGTDFTGATAVTFDGAPAAFTVTSATRIIATTPAHALGTVDVAVTGPGGSGTLTGGFTYVAPPTITVAPASGTLPGATRGVPYSRTFTASGGTGPYTFTQTGSLPAGLTLAPDGTLSGTPTGSGNSSFTVTATDSSGSPGPYSGSNAYSLTVVAPPSNNAALANLALSTGTLNPGFDSTVTSYTASVPNSAASLTVTPTVAENTASVQVNGAPTASGSPSAAIPLAVGTTTITAVVTAGDGTTTRSYTVGVTRAAPPVVPPPMPAPTLASASPASGQAGSTVVISGQNLVGATAVTFGGATAAFTIDSAMRITATAPARAPGAVNIAVTTPAGSATLAGGFTYLAPPPMPLPAPTVAAVSPESGSTAGGTRVVVTGSGLSGVSGVSFGGAAATFTVESDTRLAATAPAHAAGAVDVVVFAAGGSGSGRFTYLAPAGNDAALSGLALGAGTLAPRFDPGIASYRVDVANDVATLRLTPTAGDDGARVRVNGAAVAAGGAVDVPLAVGANTITIVVTAADGTTARTTVVTATRAPAAAPTIAVTPAALADGTVGTPYAQTLAAAGGTAPYRFALSGGALPAGLSLDANGTLAGTPAAVGTFAVTVTATDRDGFAGQGAQTLRIDAARPTAQSRTLSVAAGASASVDLTAGASGGPFTSATIVGFPDAALGTATIRGEGGGFTLLFQASPTARGAAEVAFTLSNAAGPSALATITFAIQPRPDPARDAEVIGLIGAQAESARRTADGQIRNFRDRLERTHDEATRQAGSAAISIGAPAEPADPLAFFEDAPVLGALGAVSAAGAAVDPARFGPPAGTERERAGNAVFWAGGFVNFGTNDADRLDLDQTLVGVSAGVDYRFSPRFVGGVGIGYGRDRSDIGANGSETHTDAYSGALYGSYAAAPGLFLDGLLGYGALDFASRRFAAATGAFAEGERSGEQVFGSLTATYELRSEGMLLAPYLGLQGARATLDAFTESGAGSGDLAFGEQTVSTVAGLVGLRAQTSIPFRGGVLIPRGRLEYGHDFAGASRVALGYADGGGLAFGLSEDTLSRDRLSLGLGLDARFDDGWSLALDYQPGLGLDGDERDQTVAAKVSKRF